MSSGSTLAPSVARAPRYRASDRLLPRRRAVRTRGYAYGAAMKAVRSDAGGVTVVDIDDLPGTGERIAMKATSICASDSMYIQFGGRFVLGHALAGDKASGAIRVIIE